MVPSFICMNLSKICTNRERRKGREEERKFMIAFKCQRGLFTSSDSYINQEAPSRLSSSFWKSLVALLIQNRLNPMGIGWKTNQKKPKQWSLNRAASMTFPREGAEIVRKGCFSRSDFPQAVTMGNLLWCFSAHAHQHGVTRMVCLRRTHCSYL